MNRWLDETRVLTAALVVSAGAHIGLVALLGADVKAGRQTANTPAGMFMARVSSPVSERSEVPMQIPEHERGDGVQSSALEPSAGAPSVPSFTAPGTLAVPLTGIRYYRGRELDKRPEALNEVEIVYPEEAIRARMEGTMRLNLFINDEGRLDKAVILVADPPAVFDKVVLDAVRALKFSPGMLGGRAVNSVKTIEIPLNSVTDSATLQSAQAPVLSIQIDQR